jgi:hypothetical protein
MSKWSTKESGKHASWQEINGKECLITLEPRLRYCDRGNFIAKLFPRGRLALEIDEADCWPRYYFDEERARLEVEAWLKKRGQWIIESPAPSPADSQKTGPESP